MSTFLIISLVLFIFMELCFFFLYDRIVSIMHMEYENPFISTFLIQLMIIGASLTYFVWFPVGLISVVFYLLVKKYKKAY